AKDDKDVAVQPEGKILLNLIKHVYPEVTTITKLRKDESEGALLLRLKGGDRSTVKYWIKLFDETIKQTIRLHCEDVIISTIKEAFPGATALKYKWLSNDDNDQNWKIKPVLKLSPLKRPVTAEDPYGLLGHPGMDKLGIGISIQNHIIYAVNKMHYIGSIDRDERISESHSKTYAIDQS
ncbi:unnamed protein product, partial [Didymodactylos carnosus]